MVAKWVLYKWTTEDGTPYDDQMWEADVKNLNLAGKMCVPGTVCEVNYSDNGVDKNCWVCIQEQIPMNKACISWRGNKLKDGVKEITQNEEEENPRTTGPENQGTDFDI